MDEYPEHCSKGSHLTAPTPLTALDAGGAASLPFASTRVTRRLQFGPFRVIRVFRGPRHCGWRNSDYELGGHANSRASNPRPNPRAATGCVLFPTSFHVPSVSL